MGAVLTWNELKEAVDAARAEGRRVVFTNGCFDILHVGHVRYLKAAKTMGDVLMVGLNTDRSVSTLKRGRPVVPEGQRAEVIAALETVDYVTLFDEETPYELIRLVRPDVLVKGGDWKKEEIVGSDIVPETHSLPFVDGMSTTKIIEKIRQG